MRDAVFSSPAHGASMTKDVSLLDRVDAVVIGASAGGIEALLKVLPLLPAGLKAPVLVVLHLPRDRSSLLATLFAARCRMHVCEAEDKMPVEAGTIYFAPADYHLLIDKGPILALSMDDAVNWSRPSIDVLFESAADVWGARLAAVVMTGANDDGARGLVAVRRAGGVAIVQDPDAASVRTMPEAALARVAIDDGAVDHVLPIEDIATLLQTIGASDARRVAA